MRLGERSLVTLGLKHWFSTLKNVMARVYIFTFNSKSPVPDLSAYCVGFLVSYRVKTDFGESRVPDSFICLSQHRNYIRIDNREVIGAYTAQDDL